MAQRLLLWQNSWGNLRNLKNLEQLTLLLRLQMLPADWWVQIQSSLSNLFVLQPRSTCNSNPMTFVKKPVILLAITSTYTNKSSSIITCISLTSLTLLFAHVWRVSSHSMAFYIEYRVSWLTSKLTDAYATDKYKEVLARFKEILDQGLGGKGDRTLLITIPKNNTTYPPTLTNLLTHFLIAPLLHR